MKTLFVLFTKKKITRRKGSRERGKFSLFFSLCCCLRMYGKLRNKLFLFLLFMLCDYGHIFYVTWLILIILKQGRKQGMEKLTQQEGIEREIVFTVENNKIWHWDDWMQGERREKKNYGN